LLTQSQKDGLTAAQIRDGLNQWPDLPAIAVAERTAARPAATTSSDAIDNLLNVVAMPDQQRMPKPKSVAETNPADAIIQEVLAELFAQPRFRRLEAAWRGLRLLLQQGAIEDNVRVDIAAIHPETLDASLEALSAHLVNDLPGLILLDLPFDNSPLSAERLTAAAQWAATLMVPLVAWVPPDFFQIPTWDDLSTLPYLPHHLDDSAYAKFRALQQAHDSHWICLTCNRFLTRYPYGSDNRPRQINFVESESLWVPPVWALGTLVARAAATTGRPARFTDQRRFRVQDLALHPGKATKPVAVEHLMDRDRLDQMIRGGITPLTSEHGGDSAFIPQASTLAGTSLAYQLLTSQVTQFVLWCKDNLPAENDPSALETQLRLAFQVFSEQSTPNCLDYYTISSKGTNEEGRIPLTISVTFSAAFLPGQPPIELNLDW
jgi:predicted component of type VI protein secretion system